MTLTPVLVVHGGAGDIKPEAHQAHVDGVRRAAEIGWEILRSGGAALDAVEQAVCYLEDDPHFNAGRGAPLNTGGYVELDAFIMDGATLNNGAVAAVQRIAHPVSLARLVMEHTSHSLLAAAGAHEFAERMGIHLIAESSLHTDEQVRRWREAQTQDIGHDTVGAVARDARGNIACATSTGGTRNKLPGRVGDSPLIGSGGYADNQTGGVSATGIGETLMKIVISKTVCDLIGAGLDAQAAADEAVRRLDDPRVDGSGGVIVIDRQGRIGLAYNTRQMARAYVQPDGSIVASV